MELILLIIIIQYFLNKKIIIIEFKDCIFDNNIFKSNRINLIKFNTLN